MKKLLSIFCFLLNISAVIAQSSDWKYFRPTNTGVAGEEHNFVTGDKFGNIWTGGRAWFFTGEASVVRFNHHDTIFTCWSNFENYLPSEFIYDATLDNNDHLWVATGDGLCKYDGTTWTTYTTSNTPLPSDHIRSVTIDSQNNVWITFQEVNFNIGGIAKFDGTAWTVYTSANSNLPSYLCKNIVIDSQGNKWIHNQYSVTKFDGLNFIDFNYQNSGISGPEIFDIALDSLDNLYAVAQGPFYNEVNIYNGSTWTSMNQSNTPAFAGYYIYGVHIKGNKKIFSAGGGTYAVIIDDGANWSTHIAGDAINDVYIDKDDNYWAATASSLSQYENGQWKDFMRYSAGLSEHNNYDIFIDSKNRLWAANGNGGINLFDCPRWQSYGPFNQGLYPSPQSLSSVGSTTCEDSYGNIWFAYNSTNGTVVKIPNGDYQNYAAWQTFDLSNSPVSWIVESVADGYGNVFFYSDYGTHMYNNNTLSWTTWDLTNSPLQYYSYGFGKDNTGKAYFGGHQQIAVYDNGTWSNMNLPALGAAAITVVNDIAFDSQNNLWLATEEGVWKYDGTNWTNWTSSNSAIVHNHVSSIVINKNDSVFVSSYNAQGTFYGGISIYNGTNWTTFTIANSDLPSEQIDDMELDTLGNLWINTFTKGVTVYRNGGVLGLDCMDYSLQTSGTTAIHSIENGNVQDILSFPNPFTSNTSIEFNLSETKNISLSIVDVTGRAIKNIRSKYFQPGKNKINLDLSELQSGIYFCKIHSGDNDQTVKLIKN